MLLFSFFTWIYFVINISLKFFVLTGTFCILSDVILDIIIRNLGSDYVAENFNILWSIWAGEFKVSNFQLKKNALDFINYYNPFPFDINEFKIDLFRFQFPWVYHIYKKPKPIKVELNGFLIGIKVHSYKKWLCGDSTNEERFYDAIKNARKIRLSKANRLTQIILSGINTNVEPKKSSAFLLYVSNIFWGDNEKSLFNPKKLSAIFDYLINSFECCVNDFCIFLVWEPDASSVIELQTFHIYPAKKNHREVKITGFSCQTSGSYMLNPTNVKIAIHMPSIFECFQPSCAESEKITIDILVDKVLFQVNPNQIYSLMALLKPLYTYTSWNSRAALFDARKCSAFTNYEASAYHTKYKEQYEFEKSFNYITTLIIKIFNKNVANRIRALEETESKLLVKDILHYRLLILAPNFNNEKLESKLEKAFHEPLFAYTQYIGQIETLSLSPLKIDISLENFSFIAKVKEDSLFEFFVTDLNINFLHIFSETVTIFHLRMHKLGLLDHQRRSKNAFPIFGKKSEGAAALKMSIKMIHRNIDINLKFVDLSILLIPECLIVAMHKFLSILDENQDEIDYMYHLMEEDNQMIITYSEEETHDHDEPPRASLFGPLDLNVHVIYSLCICLFENPSNMESSVLAFTSNIDLKLVSKPLYKNVVLKVDEVALQPCKVHIDNDSINVEELGLRSIFELEGDNVDLELCYLFKINKDNYVSCDQVINMENDRPSTSVISSILPEEQDLSARREISITVSDIAMNFSKDDVAVFYNVFNTIRELLIYDEEVEAARQKRRSTLTISKKKIQKEMLQKKLKLAFANLDTDQNGTLEKSEVENLLRSYLSANNDLTKDEFDENVKTFIKLADVDNSGDISMSEFLRAMNPDETHYELLHNCKPTLLAKEYVNPKFHGINIHQYSDKSHESAEFWRIYTEQTGATETSLNGQTPLQIQKKMIRVFKNYCFAHKAWDSLINPLLNSLERSPWQVTEDMHIEGFGNTFKKFMASSSPSISASTKFSFAEQSYLKVVEIICGRLYFQAFVYTFIPRLVRDKIIRAYSYIQSIRHDIWNGLIQPLVMLRYECPPWLAFSVKTLIEGANLTEKVLSSTECTTLMNGSIIVDNIVKTQFGRFYFSIVDTLLPLGIPSIDIILERISTNAIYSTKGDSSSKQVESNAYMGFYISGRYYNSHLREMESFLEPNHVLLTYNENENSSKEILLNSDRFFQVNISGSFMDRVYTHIMAFSSIESHANDVRKSHRHISQMGGIFYLKNETGTLLDYWLVTQIKSQVHENKIASKSHSVEDLAYFPVIDEDNDELLKAHYDQNMLGKEMLNAFRQADTDDSGELDHDEMREILEKLGKTKNQSEEKIKLFILDFIKLADVDNTGTVSYEEYKMAIAKKRDTTKRSISLKVKGYEPIEKIPVDILGSSLVYELIPEFEVKIPEDTSIERLYTIAVSCADNAQKIYLLRKILEKDGNYEGAISYLKRCLEHYKPKFISVEFSMDSSVGALARVHSGLDILNSTGNKTELKFVNNNVTTTDYNPGRGFFTIPPLQSINVPVNLVNEGKFVIRQVGEEYWSDALDISVCNMIESEKYGSKAGKAEGEEQLWKTDMTIDGQPVNILETGSSTMWSTWKISFQPQFIIENSLPCSLEYQIVQAIDCPDILNPKVKYSPDQSINFFQHVTEVNNRTGLIRSGKQIQVSGLALDSRAFMKCRLPGSNIWSHPFKIKFLKKYNDRKTVVKWNNNSFLFGGWSNSISFHHLVGKDEPPLLIAFAPYWIQNKSGLDLCYRITQGNIIPIEEKLNFYGEETKVSIIGIDDKRMKLSVRPIGETANDEWNDAFKCVPSFKHTGWSNSIDINNVGSNVEVKGTFKPLQTYNDGSGYFISCEIMVLPGQFYLTKLITFYPRFIIQNELSLSLNIEAEPLPSDQCKHLLRKNDSLIMYMFGSSSKNFRAKDETAGEWMPEISFLSNGSFDVWCHKKKMDGPLVKVIVQLKANTLFAILSDNSTTPAACIENRSTVHKLIYTFQGNESILPPLTCHSIACSRLTEDRPLEIFIGSKSKLLSVNIFQIKQLGKVWSDPYSDAALYSKIYIDGFTHVLSFCDTDHCNTDRLNTISTKFLRDISINLRFRGFALTICDARKELMNITIDEIRLLSSYDSTTIALSILHVQVDDMTENPQYPVVFAPLYSGYNTNRLEQWKSSDENVPFFKFIFEVSLGNDIVLFDEYELEMGSMKAQVNLDYLLSIICFLLRYVTAENIQDSLDSGIQQKNIIINQHMAESVILSKEESFLYFDKWMLKSFEFHVDFYSNADTSGSRLDSATSKTLGNKLTHVAHTTPEFNLPKVVFNSRYFSPEELIYEVILKLEKALIRQWYKIVSVDILGDPAGLAKDIAKGLSKVARQTKRDIKGESEKKGQGALTLVQTTIGLPSEAVGKSANAIGDLLKKAAKLEDQEKRYEEPTGIGSGITQGITVFGKNLKEGVRGAVVNPYEGAKNDGAKGFAKGFAKGAAGLVLSPIVGILGTTEKVSIGINKATHKRDPNFYEGVRRPARELEKSPLKSIYESNMVSLIELHVHKAINLPSKLDGKLFISLVKPDPQNTKLDIVEDEFRSSTKYLSQNPIWDESRLFEITSTNSKLRIKLYHNCSPAPKKLLGSMEIPISEIYNNFDDVVDHEIFSHSKVKEALLKKKKVRGSVLTNSVDVSCITVDGSNNETNRSENKLRLKPAKVHEFSLQDSQTKIKLYLSIRYVNHMRC